MDSTNTPIPEQLSSALTTLSDRVEDLKKNYVKREDFDRLAQQMGGGSTGGYVPQDIGASAPAGDPRVVTRDMSMRKWLQEHRPSDTFSGDDADSFSLGRAVKRLVRPDLFQDGEADVELRALAEGTDSAGGFLTPEILSGPAIDKLRAATHVINAGATIVPLGSDSHALPRLATDPTPAWKTEGAAVAVSDPAFERVTFAPKTLSVLTKLSYELFEDMAPEGDQLIETAIINSLGLELDRVFLRGTGTAPEPRGILNQSGVTLQTNGANGAAAAWSMLITAKQALQGRNVEPDGVIAHSRFEKSLASLIDTTNQYIQPPAYVNTLRRFATSQVPVNLTVGSSTDCSEVYVGKWSDLLIGVRPRLGVRIQKLNERFADNLQIGILAYVRADVQLAHADSFQVITGVRP